jgi:hypothetical protein
MEKQTDNINNEIVEVETSVSKMLQHRSDDYEYAREVLYAASEKLQAILDSAVQLAQESEHPRAIEVASNSAQTLADVAGRLMDHHLKTNKMNGQVESEKNVTNNNLNVKLNTKDLLELLGKE